MDPRFPICAWRATVQGEPVDNVTNRHTPVDGAYAQAPFTPGRMDASAEQTDAEAFAVAAWDKVMNLDRFDLA